MTEEAQLHTNVRDPAKTVDIVPGLKHKSLLNISKFTKANCLTVFNPKEVLIFNGDNPTIANILEPVLQGWMDTQTGMWRVTILPKKSKENCIPQEEAKQLNLPSLNQIMHNMYELPSTMQIIQYYYEAARFPEKST